MKKSELTQLTQIIEVLVTREIKKQLPKLIGEVFQNMAGKSMITEHIQPVQHVRREYVGKEVEAPSTPKDPHEFRASLKELFAGSPPVTSAELEEGIAPSPSRKVIQYAKDPVLNQILNETTPDLRQRECSTGLAAFHGGYNPGAPPAAAIVGAEEMMGVSALDVARAGITPPAVTEALTNYDRMKKILEQSKGKRY
jgi:hypothetical protein